MRVPAVLFEHVVNLDEAHAALDQPAGEQALAGKFCRVVCQRDRGRSCARTDSRFAFQIADFERGGLHAPAEFVAGDAGVEFGDAGTAGAVAAG